MFEDVKYFIIDMDGTFYLGDELIPGAVDFIRALQEKGYDYRFFTNNSSHDEAECMDRLARRGFPVEPGRIILSSQIAIDYIRQYHPDEGVYLLGNDKLTGDCLKAGLRLTDNDPSIVLLGFDTTLDYRKIDRCANLISEPHIHYYATHPDVNCPLADGFMPDTGAMMELFAASTGRLPELIFGKPSRMVTDFLCKTLNVTPGNLCFVGDRLETDIAIGRYGSKTALVYTGVTDERMYRRSRFEATLDVESLGALRQYL